MVKNKIFKLFFTFLPQAISVIFINAAAGSAIALLIPWIIKILIDEVFPNKNIHQLLHLLVILALVRIVSGIMLSVNSILTGSVTIKMANKLRGIITEKINNLSITALNNEKTGNLMNCISEDTASFVDIFTNIKDLFSIFVLFISQLIIVTFIAPKLLIPTIPLLLIYPFLNIFTTRKFRPLSLNYKESIGKLNNFIHEIITGNKEIKSFNRQHWQKNRLHFYFNQLHTIYLKYFKALAVSFFSNDILRLITDVSIYGCAGYLVIKDYYTAGSAIAAATYINQLINPISYFGESIGWFRNHFSSWDRIERILNLENENFENDGKTEFNASFKILEFKNVDFSYNKKDKILNKINFCIYKNSLVSIVGLSGCGKSTVINLILKLIRADKGSIRINGQNMYEIETASFRNRIAVVFQDPFLFDDTIYENIRFGNLEATEEEIKNCAERANIHEFINSLPEKYLTQIGERGVFLSGGQKQRIGIARALIKKPQILILDEATSWLDFKLEDSMVDLLLDLKKEMTVICVTHRINSVKHSDQIILLNAGKIEKTGSHKELLRTSSLYKDLVYNKISN
ncbi:MAG: ABC transporter ATP-binding protein [Spirochaetes bacterium]|nr:ABC transporter ATP-binding protein [Spirochaetota bacterium]